MKRGLSPIFYLFIIFKLEVAANSNATVAAVIYINNSYCGSNSHYAPC